MSPPHVLVVVVDGLRASALGAYGNTTYGTPAFDRFAATGLLVDWCFAPSAELSDIYQALWTASYPWRLENVAGLTAGLMRFNTNGYRTTLVTDEAAVSRLPGAKQFEQCMLHPAETPAHRPDDLAETTFARSFATTIELCASVKPDAAPQLIWLHSRGMYGPWDAPLALQEALLDDEDPPPIGSVVPPDLVLGADHDPDVAFQHATAYAAQCMVLDRCWEELLDALSASPSERGWIVTLIGARGYPLGEHSRIGGVDTRLYAEQLHVPWLIQAPGRKGPIRSGELTTHCDVLPTVAELCGLPTQTESPADSDGRSLVETPKAARDSGRVAVFAWDGAENRSIRTSEWCLRLQRPSSTHHSEFEADQADELAELFVRPDDRWEANDVAKLCRDDVESLASQLDSIIPNASAASSESP